MKNYNVDGLDETFAANIDIDDIASARVFLASFVIDRTGSMSNYESVMRDCLEHYKTAIENSKQADEMLLSKTLFNDKIQPGGYVAPADFDTSYDTWGMTRLYDAIIESAQRLVDYMDQLKANGTNCRACMIIFTDGYDNASRFRANDAKNVIADLISKEITVAFIAFGQDAFGVAKNLGIDSKNAKEVSNDEHALREVIDLASKSAISASKKASSGNAGGTSGGFFDV